MAKKEDEMTNEEEIHRNCHDSVCNGDRRHPRGAKGVSCSCRSRDTVHVEKEQLLELIADCIPYTPEGIATRQRISAAIAEYYTPKHPSAMADRTPEQTGNVHPFFTDIDVNDSNAITQKLKQFEQRCFEAGFNRGLQEGRIK